MAPVQDRGGDSARVKLSYSSLNTYETCPAKYAFQYEERLPTGVSPALSFGDSLHRALYRFHDRPVPVAPALPELHAFLDEEWVSEGYRDAAEERLYRDHAREVLASYHRDNAPEYRIPAALEHTFSVEVEGVTLVGQIDRLDRIPGGGYEIIDYKTNRRLPPRARVEKDLQLSLSSSPARTPCATGATSRPGAPCTGTGSRRRRPTRPRGSPGWSTSGSP
jgi:RecB family exonuclease